MTRNFPPGDIRVSDAERDAAIAELSEHFQSGRLTQEEFDERAGLALRARTGSDLNELFTDLPPIGGAAAPLGATQQPGATQPPPVPSPAPPWAPAPISPHAVGRRRSAVPVILAIVAIGLVINGLANSNPQHGGGAGWVLPVVVMLIILRNISRRTRR